MEQQQLAQEAVKSVTAEVSKSIKDARLQRAAARAATRAQQQQSPEQGLRALAYGEGEGIRSGKDWQEAKVRAEEWRSKAKRKSWLELRREFDDRKDYLISRGMPITDAVSYSKLARDFDKSNQPGRVEAWRAGREVKEFDSENIGAINDEERRLIEAAVKSSGRALTEEEFKQVREKARTNVAAAMQLEKMQREKVVQETENSPAVSELLIDQIASKQSELRRPLKNEEIEQMRKEIVDQLADRAMDKIRETESNSRLVEQQAVNHPKFSENFLKALNGVDITNATSEQIEAARETAMKETKKIMDKEEADKKNKLEKETLALRKTPEWRKSYALLMNQEITNGNALTSQRREELMTMANREVRIQQAEQEVNASKAEYADKQQVKTIIDARVRIAELAVQVKTTAEAANLATGADKKAREQEAVNAKSTLSETLEKHRIAAENARKRADANPADASLQNKARALEDQLREISGFAGHLDSVTIDEANQILTNEKDEQEIARGELQEAKKTVATAELKRNLLKNTNLEMHNIPDDLSQIPSGMTEQINKALSLDANDEKIEAITKLKEKAEKGKVDEAGSLLLAILLSIAMSLGESAENLS